MLSNDFVTSFEFYRQCFDATIALALSLNRTVRGRYTLIHLNAVNHVIGSTMKFHLELSSDQLLENEAKRQAGLRNISDFDITDFNYNIGIVTKTITENLHNVNFIGESVSAI